MLPSWPGRATRLASPYLKAGAFSRETNVNIHVRDIPREEKRRYIVDEVRCE